MIEDGKGKIVWIALLGVIPNEVCDLILPGEGAYVNFLTLASSEAEYRSKVTNVLGDYRLDVLEFCDIRPFSEADEPEESILKIARGLQEQQNARHVRHATFHTFPRTM